ncbi:hypothetical protein [Azospirillum sp. ST 5-10]|uniref:hypothetical protein n=1 Tax=unclassified Azospirillum TaxID=2630922 RepID=UPI003F49CA70
MLPLLMFASGVVAGVVGVRVLKSAASSGDLPAAARSGVGAIGAKAQSGVDHAQAAVRGATISGLSAIERTSANLRAKLESQPAPEAERAAEREAEREAERVAEPAAEAVEPPPAATAAPGAP